MSQSKDTVSEFNIESLRRVLSKKQSYLLLVGILSIFCGLFFLTTISHSDLHHGLPFGLFLGSVLLLVSGTYGVSTIVSNIPDTLLFSLFNIFQKIDTDKKRLIHYRPVLLIVLCVASLAGAAYFDSITTKLLCAFGFSVFFPFVALSLRYRKRYQNYQVLRNCT